MATDNVQITRDAYAMFMKGDLEGLGEYLAEDVEWETPDTLPTGGVTRGRDAVLGTFARLPQLWSEFTVQPEEYIDAGEHVIVRGVQRMAGAGGRTESRYLHLLTLHNGKVVRGEFIGDSAKALQALGQDAGAQSQPA